MGASQFTLELFTRVVHDGASRAHARLGEARCCPGVRTVLLDGRGDDLIARGDREAGSVGRQLCREFGKSILEFFMNVPVLAADLTGSTGVRADFSAEALDFLDDEFLHALDAVFFLETEVEDLYSERECNALFSCRHQDEWTGLHAQSHSWARQRCRARRRGNGG